MNFNDAPDRVEPSLSKMTTRRKPLPPIPTHRRSPHKSPPKKT